MSLTDRILAAVELHPGSTTNAVVWLVRSRKCDVIEELERLRRGNHLEVRNGPRRSKAWYAAANGSQRFPYTSEMGPGRESHVGAPSHGGTGR
jgi:hypothetical protein